MARRVKKKKKGEEDEGGKKTNLAGDVDSWAALRLRHGQRGGTPAGRRPSISLTLSLSSVGAPDDERLAGKPHLTAENVVEAQRTVRCASGRRN